MAYVIDRPEPGRQYFRDRENAIRYLDRIAMKVEGLSYTDATEHKYLRWIKIEPSYPSFDDFTFGFMNQVFSVLVLRADDNGRLLNPPSRIEALRREAKRNNLIPCVFPINDRTGNPSLYGTWNLFNPFTGKIVDPLAISSDELVELSDWEIRNWAVSFVWNSINLNDESTERLSYCDVLDIYPQIWFRDKSGKECWIEVLYAVYPADVKELTFSWEGWPQEVMSHNGYVAKVNIINKNYFVLNI